MPVPAGDTFAVTVAFPEPLYVPPALFKVKIQVPADNTLTVRAALWIVEPELQVVALPLIVAVAWGLIIAWISDEVAVAVDGHKIEASGVITQ